MKTSDKGRKADILTEPEGYMCAFSLWISADFDSDSSVTMSTMVRAERQGVVTRLGTGEEIRLLPEISRPTQPPS